MAGKNYSMLLDQIETISDKNTLKDYHAFTYWFIETSFGLEKQKILNSICDGTHDKGIDAVLIGRALKFCKCFCPLSCARYWF